MYVVVAMPDRVSVTEVLTAKLSPYITYECFIYQFAKHLLFNLIYSTKLLYLKISYKLLNIRSHGLLVSHISQ